MRKSGPSKETPPIQSLDRGLIIMEAVSKSSEPVSLAELTELLGIDRSSVFRLANTLKRRGFLAYPTGRKDYILGSALWRLAHQYDWGNMLVKISRDPLKKLAARTNETAHLAIREGKHALFVDHAAVNHVIAVSGQTGEMVPLYCTAHGKALLADLELKELRSLFGTAPLQTHTKQTVRSVTQLAETCAQIRAQGFASDDGEFQEGVRCVASPIRAHSGMIIGSIGISAPLLRFPKERYDAISQQVRETAGEISATFAAQTKEA
ncbi:MAG TPA: IclR family transcriptional regulator [Candidatus Sulfopaludibacter sp.]|jgi:IclR family acetate operon transcriptional repressor|nr:IclR family transcriptional regulator [Candidatus Sulfopaludibacter sp.]